MLNTLKLLFVASLAIAGAPFYDYDCPAKGQHFYRYPYDCAKFIECNSGVANLQDCISGLYFNEGLSFCDFPDNVECVVDEITTGPSEECPPVNGQFATYLSHETDCTKFYECDWGRPILMYCPAGLYFNHDLDVCDYPAASGCIQQ